MELPDHKIELAYKILLKMELLVEDIGKEGANQKYIKKALKERIEKLKEILNPTQNSR